MFLDFYDYIDIMRATKISLFIKFIMVLEQKVGIELHGIEAQYG